jgi:hypothetical protein
LDLVGLFGNPSAHTALDERVRDGVAGRRVYARGDPDLRQHAVTLPHHLAIEAIRPEVPEVPFLRRPAKRISRAPVHVLVVDEDDRPLSARGEWAAFLAPKSVGRLVGSPLKLSGSLAPREHLTRNAC